MIVVARPIAPPYLFDDLSPSHLVDCQNVLSYIWNGVIHYQFNDVVLLRPLGSFLERKVFNPLEGLFASWLRVKKSGSTV